MNKEKPSKRTYNSSRRKEQARLTSRQIVGAARKLFIDRGYSGATIEAIAQEAGVAAETVYAAFGNKRAILSKLIDVSIVGDDESIPLLQRSGPQSVQQEKNQHRQIQLFARDMQEIMGRMAPIFEIMRVAAKTEPDISDALQNVLENRVHGMEEFIRYLTTNGSLQEYLTLGEAAETVWAISSAEVYSLLTIDRGWSGEQYQQWLAKMLTKILLK
ncbi:MAG: TetR/AcrR family transcriptional regulator [Anaerolineae bacterium]|nr:TetR/AcrR family transcriptional regulator [Anaerolineae bacterium]